MKGTIVIQPNGFYGVFDPIGRDFDRINLTEEEVLNFLSEGDDSRRYQIKRNRLYKAKKAGATRWQRAMSDVAMFQPAANYTYYTNRMSKEQLTYGN